MMTDGVNTRELALNILLQIEKEEAPCHVAVRQTLEKYQFLPKQDRAFITRLCDGSVEYQIQNDYVINQYSKTKIHKCKPVIRALLRMSVYQIRFMDSVPDSAVVNEAVKLAARRGFFPLKGFVNGVLRSIVREKDHLTFPGREEGLTRYLSVRYSMPEFLVEEFLEQYSEEETEKMLASFLETHPTTIRINRFRNTEEETLRSLEKQGVTVEKAPYVKEAWYIRGYDHLNRLSAFLQGRFQVQDVSSMLVAHAADPHPGDTVLDLCAAPGGKSLHMADRMLGCGFVQARDLTPYKVDLIRENVERSGLTNVVPEQWDATVPDEGWRKKADVVLADVPCSGYGVIGKKPDIRYHASKNRETELIHLQKKILENAAEYVKEGGILVFSTCTVNKKENEENLWWFLEKFPFEPVSLDDCLPEELRSEETAKGYLQLLPGVHKCDGFFLAKLRRKEDTDE